eukprot:SM000078S22087  [mRNA]  locus=s78:302868:304776:- [translate_table: standard]
MRKKLDTRFPSARIKKIMQADEEVGKIAQATPVGISRALELFLQDLCDKTYRVTQERGSKTVTVAHLKQCIERHSAFDFLRELVTNFPDPGLAGAGDASSAVASPSRESTVPESGPGGSSRKRPALNGEAGAACGDDSGRNMAMKLEHGGNSLLAATPASAAPEHTAKRGRGRSRGGGNANGKAGRVKGEHASIKVEVTTSREDHDAARALAGLASLPLPPGPCEWLGREPPPVPAVSVKSEAVEVGAGASPATGRRPPCDFDLNLDLHGNGEPDAPAAVQLQLPPSDITTKLETLNDHSASMPTSTAATGSLAAADVDDDYDCD